MAFVLLDTKQLRTLAEVIYYGEVEAVRNIPFSTEQDRVAYLTGCRDNYQAVLAFLDSADQLKHEFQGDSVKVPIADNILSYLEISVNASLQTLRNYEKRLSYINKVKEHADEMMKSLRTLNVADAAAVEQLEETAASFKKIMLEYHRTWNSPSSKNFSRVLQESGMTFQELVSRYQANLKFEGKFESLSDDKKILVYDSNVKASGKESSVVDLMKNIKQTGKVHKKVGTAFLLIIAGTAAWHIFSSENKVDAALSNHGGGVLGKVLGITAGIAGAVVLGMFASWFAGRILTSGGYPVIATTDLHYYVAQTPDGVALARQIAHGSN